MNSTKFSLLFILNVFFASIGIGQERLCATDEMVAKSLKENPELLEGYLAEQQRLKEVDQAAYSQGYPSQTTRAGGCKKYIPIVFHIVHQNGSENISSSQVQDAVRILNEDFSESNPDLSTVVNAFKSITGNAGFQFVLATKDPNGSATTGIVRHVSSETNVGDDGTISQFIWPRNKYLNVIVVKTITSGAAGFTYLPGSVPASSDAIVIKSTYVGSIGTGSPSRSRSLTHEVGHWFNLPHCWGFSNTPGLSTNCNDDDNVLDTPNTVGWQSCNLSGSSCGSPLDNVQNFLEYSYCSKMFTDGQASRMQAVANSTTAQRMELWQSSNLTATGISSTAVLCEADFKSSSTTNSVCQGGSLTFTDLSYSGTPTSYNWTFTGGTPASSSAASPTIQYNTPGVYSVSLTVSNSSGSVSKTKTAYVTVVKSPGLNASPFYSEGFEGTGMPTDFIIINENSSGSTWTQTSSAAATGIKSAMISNAASYDGDVDELIGPSINMTTVGVSPTLTFKVAHAQKLATSNDKLSVYVSTNCGVSWLIRMNLNGTTLSTAGVQSGATFTPNASQWVTKSISLNGYVSSTALLYKFVFTSDGGHNVFIDDINISGQGIGIDEQIANSLNLNVYPNPMESNSIISFTLLDKQNVDIKILDVVGREVSSVYSGNLNAGEYQYSIDGQSALSSGVYFVRLVVNNQLFTKKLIVR